MKTQQGITLFIVIIILVVVTSLAAAVITETRLGQNAIGLTQERLANEQELLGGVDQIINDAALINNIMAMTEDQGANMVAVGFNTTANIQLRGEAYCKRTANASSINLINCRYARIDFTQANDQRRVQGGSMTSGIEQPFLVAQNK
ncbi:hypothetical protein FR932_15275 [Moritella marina ATCC 15381]|uniref:Pilus assembly protein PilX n=1 Tax=Moritella marina ATCC 15381 TaxID=1202962 RepID=A0A5J6WLU3_MORMI|nr:hypothetical protein [Moritella marina]QFI39116.1 hypothetical protein FR932_15275 [Moritella marina ATCC 15381]